MTARKHDSQHGHPLLLQVRSGALTTVQYRGREISTGFRKEERHGLVALGVDGVSGDVQADMRVHGGREKALCVYPAEHYPKWRELLNLDLPWGSFGENLVVHGLTEDRVYLGDEFTIGEAVVQVSMPRRPCFKLAAIHGVDGLPSEVQRSGRTGYYLRVVVPGLVEAGMPVKVTPQATESVTVQEVNRVMNLDRNDHEAAAALSRLATVPARWREVLRRRLEGGMLEDDSERLRGP